MSGEMGLRERKKQQTRLRIQAVALELFGARGFDAVPVAEIARGADVSEATVFNYFPTKEDLIYAGMEAFEEELLDAVRTRPMGTPAHVAFRDYVLQPRGALADPDPAAMVRLATVARIIAGSAALQAREHWLVDHTARALAGLIAHDMHARTGDLRPWVVAHALMGVNRAMTSAIHRHAIAGHSSRTTARQVLIEGRRAFDLLEHGLLRPAPIDPATGSSAPATRDG